MWKKVLIAALIFTIVCSKHDPIVVSPYHGVTIVISHLSVKKAQERVIGSVQIQNQSENFVRVSNRELFLFSGEDSSRTYIDMPGEWKIDEGLINVMKGKTITFKAYWQLHAVSDTLRAKYLHILEREDG
jgi:hypothetical protein